MHSEIAPFTLPPRSHSIQGYQMMTTGRTIALALLFYQANAFNFGHSAHCVRPAARLLLGAGGSADDLAGLTVPDLKEKCRERGLKVSAYVKIKYLVQQLPWSRCGEGVARNSPTPSDRHPPKLQMHLQSRQNIVPTN